MTRYLAIGAICGFGLAVLLLSALGDKGTREAVNAAVAEPAAADAGRGSVALQPLPMRERLRLPGNAFNPSRERLTNPQLVPIGMRPVQVTDGGQ